MKHFVWWLVEPCTEVLEVHACRTIGYLVVILVHELSSELPTLVTAPAEMFYNETWEGLLSWRNLCNIRPPKPNDSSVAQREIVTQRLNDGISESDLGDIKQNKIEK